MHPHSISQLTYTGIPLDVAHWPTACQEYRSTCDAEHAAAFDQTPWLELVSTVGGDGRLHPQWRQRGATPRYYGALTIHGSDRYLFPGIPRGPMREAVRAEGSVILCADWSASHLRLLADVSGDAALIASLSGGDPYLSVTEALGLDPAERPHVKTAVLHTINGGGIRTRWAHLPFDAHRLEGVLRSLWPDAWATLMSWRQEAEDHGRVTIGTRRCKVPEGKHYAAAAYVLQALESEALVRAVEAIGSHADVILVAHDEIVVEVTDPSHLPTVEHAVQEAMERAPQYRHAALRTGAVRVSHGPSWGQQDGSGPYVPEGRDEGTHLDIATVLNSLAGLTPVTNRAPDPQEDAEDARGHACLEAAAHLRADLQAREKDAETLSEDLVKGAQRAQEYARELAPLIRRRWREAGLVLRAEGCGSLPQGLLDYHTGRGLHIGRNCGRDDCAFCGPYRVALRLGGLLYMPIVGTDETDLHDPMGSADVHLYMVPEDRWTQWQQAWRKQQRRAKQAEMAAIEEAENRSDRFCGNGLTNTVMDTAKSVTSAVTPRKHVYVAFHRPGRRTVVLSTLRITRRGETRPAKIARDRLPAVLGRLAGSTYRPERDEWIPEIVRLTGHTTSADGLSLRPDTIAQRARPHGWGLVRTDLCTPAEGSRRLRQDGESPRVQRAADHVIQAVELEPRPDAEWDATWARLGVDGREPRRVYRRGADASDGLSAVGEDIPDLDADVAALLD